MIQVWEVSYCVGAAWMGGEGTAVATAFVCGEMEMGSEVSTLQAVFFSIR
jgi:hypothetical protein